MESAERHCKNDCIIKFQDALPVVLTESAIDDATYDYLCSSAWVDDFKRTFKRIIGVKYPHRVHLLSDFACFRKED